MWECGEGHTDTQTRVTNIHIALSTTQRKMQLISLTVIVEKTNNEEITRRMRNSRRSQRHVTTTDNYYDVTSAANGELNSAKEIRYSMLVKVKVKASHTRHRALGPELIPVYRQSARR